MEILFNGKKAEQGIDRVNEKTKKLGRGGRRTGMAMLEASRAIEDFSVAGMRGALNNIPGLTMSLTGHAGLAAASSIVALALWKLAPKIFGIGEAAKKSSGQIEALNQNLARLDAFHKKERLSVLESVMGEESNADNLGRSMRRLKDLFAQRAAQAKRDRTSRGSQPELTEIQKQKQAVRDASEDVKRLNKQVQESGNLFRQAYNEAVEFSSQVGKNSSEIFRKEGVIANFKQELERVKALKPFFTNTPMKIWQQAATKQYERLIQVNEAQVGLMKEEDQAAKKTYDTLMKQVEAARELSKEQKEMAKDAFAELRGKQKTLEATKKQKQEEREKKNRSDYESALSKAMGLYLGGNKQISGRGRSGLGGGEAMQSLSIQRGMLNQLKKINRTLKNHYFPAVAG